IFKFFKSEVDKLQEFGEVFYSENFKGIKHLGTKSINGDIKAGRYNYFEIDFILGDINPSESSNILRAFRNNLKYYKLQNGEYLDLEEIELNKFLKLLDVINPSDEIIDNKISFNKNKGAFVDSFLDDNKIRFIKGKKELKEIRDKFKSIDKLKFKEPKELKADLREYQKHGYNWCKTLDYLGFGGILGDEMGLGKTLQAITFILSSVGSKTLIVAPTSLIYNWHSELNKFAPSLKAVIVNGNPEEREIMIKNIDKVDVVITTYNLLKRDLETYKNIEFDYCFLDEAQYIKNPHSQNAKSVKEIQAKSRFALTGTPIENSLMELWSIFDFVMPDYLYDEKRFSVRYHKKLKEGPEVLEELNKLIKPFILRRHKKDVISELPNKIEKKLIVALNDEQRKIYGTYAKHATELIAKKVKDDEFKSSKIEILSYITKLRQLCLDPSLLVDNYTGGSGKIDALLELLHQSIEANHKVLVFSQFTSILKNISTRLSNEGISYSYLDGSIPSEKRMSMVKDFNEGNNSVFLISLKAGGTG
ncbi:MAG: SNF2-related protein, partial [Clostridium sp.]